MKETINAWLTIGDEHAVLCQFCSSNINPYIPYITVLQLKMDIQYVYGALHQSILLTSSTFPDKHFHTKDGIACWEELMDTYTLETNMSTPSSNITSLTWNTNPTTQLDLLNSLETKKRPTLNWTPSPRHPCTQKKGNGWCSLWSLPSQERMLTWLTISALTLKHGLNL